MAGPLLVDTASVAADTGRFAGWHGPPLVNAHGKQPMSSSSNREPLTGVIRQDASVVGAICLPDAELQEFIEQFNHCYGSIGMRIEIPPGAAPTITGPTHRLPVGAAHRQPLKPPNP